MDRDLAKIERVGVYKIGDLFKRKPHGLRFNETEAVVVSLRAEDGKKATATFYLSIKPDGTFDEKCLGTDACKARRRGLASFIRYYGFSKEISLYNLRDRIGEWIGKSVEVLPINDSLVIYVPQVISR
jgi:hypothetical protein